MLNCSAPPCSSVDYCSPSAAAGEVPDPIPASSRCIISPISIGSGSPLQPQKEMFPWPAAAPMAVEGCYEFALPRWSRVGKVLVLFVLFVYFLVCFLRIYLNSATCHIKMHIQCSALSGLFGIFISMAPRGLVVVATRPLLACLRGPTVLHFMGFEFQSASLYVLVFCVVYLRVGLFMLVRLSIQPPLKLGWPL